MANSDIDKDLTRTQDDVKIWPLATVPVQLSRLHERSPSGTTSPHSAALNSQVMAMADGSGFQKLTRKVMPRVLVEIKTAGAYDQRAGDPSETAQQYGRTHQPESWSDQPVKSSAKRLCGAHGD